MKNQKSNDGAAVGAVGTGDRVRLFLVVWDDEQGLCVPMAWDTDCEGAICAGGSTDKLALFRSRKAARKAIDVSAKFAALLRAQGKPANDDFLGGRSNLRICECA